MDSQRLKQSQRQLCSAVEVARDRQVEAANALKQMQSRADRHRRQLDQLVDFRQEYNQQLADRGKGGISARQLQHYRAFINGLDRNIQRLEGELAGICQETERRLGQWRQQRAQTCALEQVIDGIARRQQVMEERREQAECDELSLRSRRFAA